MRKEIPDKYFSLSVVIPSYGRPDHLKACIGGLMCQTFIEPWEIVIIDDGSSTPITRQSLSVSDSLIPPYPHIRIIRQNNAGPATARNRGVAAAKGQLIAFIDDDCVPEPRWLSQLVHYWRQHRNYLVGGSTINGLKNNIYADASQAIVSLVYRYFNTDPETAVFLASNNILCSKAQFQQLGGFAEDFPRAGAEDRDFCDRWRMMKWKIAWDQQALVNHYHHQNLSGFIDLHIRYGRGAYIYHKKRRQRRSGTIAQDIGFHKSLPRLLLDHSRHESWPITKLIKTIGCFLIWQIANTLGFLVEMRPHRHLGKKPRGLRPLGHKDYK